MSGNSKQDKIKRERSAKDMSAPAELPTPKWVCPPPEELEESANYTLDPSEACDGVERITVRMVDHFPTGSLVEFAVIHDTFHKGKWTKVAVADSSHDDEVHVHYYSRKTGNRVGSPEVIMPVTSTADISAGYDLAYERMVSKWADNKRRWHDA